MFTTVVKKKKKINGPEGSKYFCPLRGVKSLGKNCRRFAGIAEIAGIVENFHILAKYSVKFLFLTTVEELFSSTIFHLFRERLL